MTVPRALGLVALAVIAALAVAVSQLNEAPATLDLPGLPPFTAPLWVIFFFGVVSGGVLTAAYVTALSSRDALARWRQERVDRQNARLERLHADGIRALLGRDPARARQFFDQVTEQAPDRGESWLLAGDAARLSGDIDGATDAHLRAQGLMPEDPRVLDALARDAEAAGDLERARRYQDQLIERHGATPARRERQRDLAVADGDWGVALMAEEECARGRKRTEAEERLLRGLRIEAAVADAAAGVPETALIAARRLANEAPDFEPAYAVLADIHLDMDNPAGAVEVLQEGVRATDSLELIRRLVDLHLDLEEPEAAITVLRAATVELEGDAAVAARILLGRLYHHVGLVEEAEAEFEALADVVEDSPLVDYYRARTRYRRGKPDRAFEMLRDSVRASGSLDARFRCGDCGTRYSDYQRRCDGCGAWGTLSMDIARDAHAAEPVKAPVI